MNQIEYERRSKELDIEVNAEGKKLIKVALGDATLDEAMVAAFKQICYASMAIGEEKNRTMKGDFLNEQAGYIEKIKDISSMMKKTSILFDQYHQVQNSIVTMANLLDDLSCYLYVFMTASPKNKVTTQSTYIIKNLATGKIKIGKSINIKQRVRTLENMTGATITVLATINKDVEHKLHKRFSHLRDIGEWFIDTNNEISSFAKSVKEGLIKEI